MKQIMSEHDLNSFGSFEREKTVENIPNVEVLALIGHSIEHDETRGWVPTRLIQKMGEGKKRTGIRDRSLGPDDEGAYAGGGNAVALAAAEMYETLIARGSPPKTVSVVPGRALYLENTPSDVNKGAVMLDAFRKKVERKPDTVVTLEAARNTQGELEQHLKMCVERGYKSIGFVLLDLRIPRVEALLEKLKLEHPEFQGLQIHVLSAETLLRERYKDNPNRLKELETVLGVFSNSEAHKKTVADEKGGTEAIRAGTYKGKGNY